MSSAVSLLWRRMLLIEGTHWVTPEKVWRQCVQENDALYINVLNGRRSVKMKVRIAYEVEEIDWKSGLKEIHILQNLSVGMSTHEQCVN